MAASDAKRRGAENPAYDSDDSDDSDRAEPDPTGRVTSVPTLRVTAAVVRVTAAVTAVARDIGHVRISCFSTRPVIPYKEDKN